MDLLERVDYLKKDVVIEQDSKELMHLIVLARKMNVQTVLEIGSRFGGTLKCWLELLYVEKAMVVDLPLGSDEECVKQRVEAWKRWPRGQQLKIHLGDSQASEADAAVKSAINKWGIGKFDMVFIDAGHKYEEVKADYERYAQYAKKLIAFHGIQPSKVLAAEDFGVDRFWKEVKQDRPSIEIVASETYGIGVLPLI